MAKHIDNETLEKVADMLQQSDMSYRDIAKTLSVSKTAVSRVAKKLKLSGITINREPAIVDSESVVSARKELYDKILERLRNTQDFHSAIAKDLGVSQYTVTMVSEEYLTKEEQKKRSAINHSEPRAKEKSWFYGKRGSETSRYKTGTSFNKGYKGILLSTSSLCNSSLKGNYVAEHILKMCEALGINRLPEGNVIHHCDCNKLNNDIGNLIMIPIGLHNTLHGEIRKLRTEGVTTISKESTAKWLEARLRGDNIPLKDIVYSGQECSAADNAADVE